MGSAAVPPVPSGRAPGADPVSGSLRSKLLQPWVVMPVVAVLLLGGWFAYRDRRDDGGASSAQTITATDQEVEVTVGDLAQTVSAEGTVAAAQTDDLSFASAGTVTAVNVKAGDQVKAGQVLATIDSAELEAAVSDAESSLADAEAALADDTDAGASDEQLEADEAAVTTAQDNLASARDDLAGAQLVATFDGTVATVDLTVGEQLTSGGSGGTTPSGSASGSGNSASTLGSSSSGPGGQASGGASGDSSSSAQIQVTSAGSFTVELSFDDTDISKVAVGDLASVRLATSSTSNRSGFGGFGGFGGFPGQAGQGNRTGSSNAGGTGGSGGASGQAAGSGGTSTTGDAVDGLVTDVGTVADASSGVASYPVTVAFLDDTRTFNVGATVSVDITYDKVADAIQVPVRAVTTNAGTSTVTVVADGKRETRTVTTGITADGMVQITEGLKAGEKVVIQVPSFRPPTSASGSGSESGVSGAGGPGGGFVPPNFQGGQVPGGGG